MDSISEIFHNPSFKKDFAFIKQLEAENKVYQDRIWKKFADMQVSSEENSRIVKNRFDSHPSGFSSDSENSNTDEVAEFLREQPSIDISSPNFTTRSEKQKERSASASKMLSNDVSRKKLRKKITQHLKNGTIDKFDIKAIGDQLAADRNAKENKKKTFEANKEKDDGEEIEEMYVESSKFRASTSSSTSRNSSYSSLNDNVAEIVDLPSIPKVRGKIEENLEIPIRSQKIRSSVKFENQPQRNKSPKTKESKKKIPVFIASAELKKSRYYIEKCIAISKEIGTTLNQELVPPDGREDYSRRKVRTNEFNSRFSRIYMYPLVRQLSSINVPSTTEKTSTNIPKLGITFQLIFQALQAYYNHLPATVGTDSYHKLKEYLVYVKEVCDKSNRYYEKQPNFNNQDYADMLKSQCIYLMNKLDDNFLSTSVDSLLKTKSTRGSIPASQSNKNFTANSAVKDSPRTRRFAMYNNNLSSKRDRQWRRMIEAAEKRKPKVKSRYRTATFKHRPPVEKQNNQMMIQLGKHRLDVRRSMTSWQNTPVSTPLNEDNIQTMIQYEKERYDGTDDSAKDALEEENEEEEQQVDASTGRAIIVEKDLGTGEEKQQQEDILAKLLRLVQDNHQEPDTEPDASLTNTIKVLQQCLDFKNQNSEMFKKMATESERNLTLQKNFVVTSGNNEKKKKDPLITVTGTKNAQLICIKDENSIVSDVEESVKNIFPQNSPRKATIHVDVQSSSSEVMEEQGVANQPSRMNIKISRINISKKMLKLLPKEYVINVIQHKLMFHKQSKDNYMYRKSSTGKPWELFEKISDEILDFALLGIVKEIEVNELLENIYNAEFQY